VKFSNSGNLEIHNGSSVDLIALQSSGSILVSNSSVFGLELSDSGNITIRDASNVGEVESEGSGYVTISDGVEITSVSVEMTKSVKLSGSVNVEREVEAAFVEGTIELFNVTIGAFMNVDKSPGTHVRIYDSKVPELALATAGDLDIASGSELGSIDVKGSGNLRLSGSAAAEVMISESGNLTLSDGAKLLGVDLDRSGHLSITHDVTLSEIMCRSSGGIAISNNVTVERGIEAFNIEGSFLVSSSTVGGPVSVVSAGGDIVFDASTVDRQGLVVEKCSGSVGLRASSFPSFEVKGLSGDIAFVDMQAHNLNLQGVEGEVLFSGVRTSGSSVLSNIGGGVVCPSAQVAATPAMVPPGTSWDSWLQSFLWPAA